MQIKAKTRWSLPSVYIPLFINHSKQKSINLQLYSIGLQSWLRWNLILAFTQSMYKSLSNKAWHTLLCLTLEKRGTLWYDNVEYYLYCWMGKPAWKRAVTIWSSAPCYNTIPKKTTAEKKTLSKKDLGPLVNDSNKKMLKREVLGLLTVCLPQEFYVQNNWVMVKFRMWLS